MPACAQHSLQAARRGPGSTANARPITPPGLACDGPFGSLPVVAPASFRAEHCCLMLEQMLPLPIPRTAARPRPTDRPPTPHDTRPIANPLRLSSGGAKRRRTNTTRRAELKSAMARTTVTTHGAHGRAFTTVFAGLALTSTSLPKISLLPACHPAPAPSCPTTTPTTAAVHGLMHQELSYGHCGAAATSLCAQKLCGGAETRTKAVLPISHPNSASAVLQPAVDIEGRLRGQSSKPTSHGSRTRLRLHTRAVPRGPSCRTSPDTFAAQVAFGGQESSHTCTGTAKGALRTAEQGKLSAAACCELCAARPGLGGRLLAGLHHHEAGDDELPGLATLTVLRSRGGGLRHAGPGGPAEPTSAGGQHRRRQRAAAFFTSSAATAARAFRTCGAGPCAAPRAQRAQHPGPPRAAQTRFTPPCPAPSTRPRPVLPRPANPLTPT